MKKYVSFKQVSAEEMSRNEFVNMVKTAYDHNREADVPIAYWENKYNTGLGSVLMDVPGYHVVYSEGTPNEYHSWSPRDSFVNGYMEIGEDGVKMLQNAIHHVADRALDEANALRQKLVSVFK